MASPQQTRDLFRSVFSGQEDYIPLMVTPPCGAWPDRKEFTTDTRNAVRKAVDALRPKVEADTDWLPTINI